MEDHLEFLQTTLEDTWDRDTRDEIQDQIIKVTEAKRDQDRKIIDSQIAFYQKDNTTKSLNAGMDLVRKQLLKPEIQRDNTLRTAYEQQLTTLQKERLEIDVEDKSNWMVMEMISTERTNPSLWKLAVFSGFRDKAGTDAPVNIGGIRYNSEREYWQTTLNNYIQSNFANEYAKENKNEASLMWNKLGLLPDTYLKNLVTKNNLLRTNPELQPFQTVISSAIQDAITNALDLKSRDITAKYYLDKLDIATTSSYEQAKQELENLKILFGADYSLSPEIQKVETKLLAKKVQQVEAITADITKWMNEFYKEQGRFPTSDEISNYIKTQAKTVITEIEPEELKAKRPEEMVEEELITKPALEEKKTELEKEVEETEKKIEEAKKAKEEEPKVEEELPVEEKPPVPSVYTGPSIVDYLKSIGQSSDFASRAKLATQYGITDYRGTAEQNTRLLNLLKKGVTSAPVSTLPVVEKPKVEKPKVEKPTLPTYTGPSIVDYLKSAGQASSFASRKRLAVQQGIVRTATEYVGSAVQNTALLKKVRGF